MRASTHTTARCARDSPRSPRFRWPSQAAAADEHVEIDVPAQVDAAFPEDDGPAAAGCRHPSPWPRSGSSGAIVGVWAPWSGTLGHRCRDAVAGRPKPVTDDMQFRAGRVTRAMTCDVLYARRRRGPRAHQRPRDEVRPGVPRPLRRDARPAVRQHLRHRLLQRRSCSGLFLSNPDAGLEPARARQLWPRSAARGSNPARRTATRTPATCCSGSRSSARRAAAPPSLSQDYVVDPLDLTATELPAGASAAPSTDSAGARTATTRCVMRPVS